MKVSGTIYRCHSMFSYNAIEKAEERYKWFHYNSLLFQRGVSCYDDDDVFQISSCIALRFKRQKEIKKKLLFTLANCLLIFDLSGKWNCRFINWLLSKNKSHTHTNKNIIMNGDRLMPIPLPTARTRIEKLEHCGIDLNQSSYKTQKD